MAKSKKSVSSSKSASSRRKKAPAKKSQAGSSTQQPKANLQPARRIRNEEAVTSSAPSAAEAASAEELQMSPTSVMSEPAPTEEQSQEPAVLETAAQSTVQNESKPEEPEHFEESVKVLEAHPLETSVSSVDDDSKKPAAITLPPSVKKLRLRRIVRRVLLGVAALGVLGAAAFVYSRITPDPGAANNELIVEVSQRAVVPADETPAISTVVDETQVNQEFLRGTKKGDKVLLYFQAGRAIVYRPSEGKIINMGPIETPKPRVFLRNGSSAAQVESVAGRLGQAPDFLVVSRDDSPKKSYEKTIVVDVTGVRPDVAARLASLLGATVGTLPEGESRPDADVLVIVGRN